MEIGTTPDQSNIIKFGPFSLSIDERLLARNGVPIRLSSRALDILITLVERAGEVVSQRELLAQAWAGVTVSKSGLRVHIAGLRRALGDGADGARYVTTVPGRGYCFVAPILPLTEARDLVGTRPKLHSAMSNLPSQPKRLLGRDGAIQTVRDELMVCRFVCIVGPGGVGKTTVAISAAHAMAAHFNEEPIFLDLGSINDSALVMSAIASTLNITAENDDPIRSIVSSLANRHLLLILDNCEHVIDQIAPIAESIFTDTPRVHILATSREALRTEGERVFRLHPLASPADTADLTADRAMTFPAVQLFVERAAARGIALQLTDDEAPIVAGICNKLDGLPLAIEIAAGRVTAHGLHGTAALLGNRFNLEWRGRRTAVPRHQTFNATLNWSYRLLPEREQSVLRRLSVFVGPFGLGAAEEIAHDGDNEESSVAEVLVELAAKSLVSVISINRNETYRLLETTRVYAFKKLKESGEADIIANRHANHFVQLLRNASAEQSLFLDRKGTRIIFTHLGNVRAALSWCFSSRGDATIGARLVITAAHFFIECSLLGECTRWANQALSALAEADRGTSVEMELQEALATSLMFTQGDSDKVCVAIARGLSLAEQLGDDSRRLRMLAVQHFLLSRRGDIRGALAIAEQSKGLAHTLDSPVGTIMADLMLGFGEHLMGNQRLAQKYIRAGLARVAASPNTHLSVFGSDNRMLFVAALARALWVQGLPEQALKAAQQALNEGEKATRAVTKCISLIHTASVFIWCGDQMKAHDIIDALIIESKRGAFTPYEAVGVGLKGELLIKEGQILAGIETLRWALRVLHRERHNIRTITLTTALAVGLMDLAQFDSALTEIEGALSGAKRNGNYFSLPELLRVKGDILWKMKQKESLGAESCFLNSLHRARSQGDLSWELRTARSLAKLMYIEGRADHARRLLSDVYGKFTEGFATSDLEAANSELNAMK